MQDDLRSILGFEDDVRVGKSAVVVAALVRVRSVVRVRLLPDRSIRVEERL